MRHAYNELLRFCAVGAAGFVVNLIAFSVALDELGTGPLTAATVAFAVAVTHNFLLNRHWTFQGAGGSLLHRATKFFAVSVGALGANLLLLSVLVHLVAKIPAQAVAVVLVTPLSFLANKLWSFRSFPAPAANAVSPRQSSGARLCVCVPTYNEIGNIHRFVEAVLAVFSRCEIDGTILIIDDGSPDGTGDAADAIAAREQRVKVLHRAEKNGLGPAYFAGFEWALARRFDLVAQVDCDFSHDPAALPELVSATGVCDLAIGSRYVAGGGVVNWPLRRQLISRFGSVYARLTLGLGVRDLTGGFKCWRSAALRNVIASGVEARGYGFQIETTYRAASAGFSVSEVPITFRDRVVGESKMSLSIAREAAALVLRLRLAEHSRPGGTRITEPLAGPAASGVTSAQTQ